MPSIASDHMKVLTADLEAVSAQTANQVFANDADQSGRAAIAELILRARDVQRELLTRPLTAMITTLHSPGWDRLLEEAAHALRKLPCLHIFGSANGDTTGRDDAIPGSVQTPGAPVSHQVQNLGKKAIYSVALITAATGLFFSAIPWWRRRQTLRRRRAKRFATDLNCEVTLGQTTFPAQIINLSCTGAKLRYQTQTQLPDKGEISLTVDEVAVPAHLIWANNFYFGIRFASPLRIKTVRRLANVHRFDGLGRKRPKEPDP